MRLAISIAMFLAAASATAMAQPHVTDEARPAETEPRALDRDLASIDAGVSILSRTLAFNSRTFPQAPPGFKSTAGGIRVSGELYPLADNTHSLLSGLGIAGEVDKAVGLVIVSGPSMMTALDQHVWSLGARYRWQPRDGVPTITVAVDYSHRVFAVDRTTAQMVVDLPDVDYAAFEPGLDVRVPVTRTASLVAGARATLLVSAGAIAEGNSYGRGHAVGDRVMTGLDVVLGRHAALRLTAEVAQLGMAFYGTGKEAIDRDGDPTTLDVAGASDSSYRTSATVAVFY